MPVLRSQRSKTSGQAGQDAVPPRASSPPRSRSTRGKKASKASEDVEVDDKQSVAASSSKSTKTRTRSKPARVEEEVVQSPPHPSVKSTRSTKTAKSTTATTSKKTRSTARIQEKESKNTVPRELDPVVAVTPLDIAKSKASARIASKKGTSRSKKAKEPVQSTSSDVTDEEGEGLKRKLTQEEMYKYHTLPLKTMLSMGAECIPKILGKLRDTREDDKLNEEFQRLMSSTEMLPPLAPAPKPKGKGRQKRGRSPEKEPVKATKVPTSFDFAAEPSAEEQAPAKKILVMDQATPETEELPEIKDTSSEKESAQSQPKGNGKKKKLDLVSTAEEEDAPEIIEKPKKTGKSRKKKIVEQPSTDEEEKEKPTGKVNGNEESGKSKKKKKKMMEVPSEKKTSETEMEVEETEAVDDSKPADNAVAQAESTKEPCLPKEETKLEKAKSSENVLESDLQKKQTLEPEKKMLAKMNETVDLTSSINSPKDTTGTAEDKAAKVPLADESCILFETSMIDGSEEEPAAKVVSEKSPAEDEKPKSNNLANETIIISKPDPASEILAPESPERVSETKATSSAGGSTTKVSSLVNFFDKNRKEADVQKKLSFSKASKLNETRCISPTIVSAEKKSPASNADLNSTYILPTAKAANSSSALNVTVCVSKSNVPEKAIPEEGKSSEGITPIVPPASFLSTGRFVQDPPAMFSFIKEPPSLAMVIEEEDDKESVASEKADKVRPVPNAKPASKDKGKNASTSSSSSSSSMKSASSNPCLSASKKMPTSATKTGATYGSTGKLNEVTKSKTDDAERRRQEILQQRIEASKKKHEEWMKKAERKKLEEEKKRAEEEKRLKEKQKAMLLPSTHSASSLAKKPVPLTGSKPVIGAPGCPKPQFTLGPAKAKPIGTASSAIPPLSKNPFHKPIAVKQPLPTPREEEDPDESFKSTCSNFLDQTHEGHLSSYDITVYEDLDEDLKHRENKNIPSWASDKEAIKTALFSMVLLEEYQHKIPSGFPKPDRTYKLFPNKPY